MLFGSVLGRCLQWRVGTFCVLRAQKSKTPKKLEPPCVHHLVGPRSDLVVRANLLPLREYKRKFGMICIPRNYAFSKTDESLPAELRGFPMYKEANVWRSLKSRRLLHKEDVEELSGLGFEWDIRRAQYLTRCHQLSIYREIYGDLTVPSLFRVPENAPKWPEPYWSLPLGTSVADMRRPKRALFKRHLGEMKKNLKIDISPRIGHRDVDSLLTALKAYRVKYGADATIPQFFTVPDTDDWPLLARKVKLGQNIKNMFYKNTYSNHREDFRKLGVNLYGDDAEKL